ncbi:hypothetical protein E5355_06035, partial [Bacteroides muris (ex Afrizal et al. 2022)]
MGKVNDLSALYSANLSVFKVLRFSFSFSKSLCRFILYFCLLRINRPTVVELSSDSCRTIIQQLS